MKRQHPDNPDLFWCHKCQFYKTKDLFFKNKSRKDSISCLCKKCHMEERDAVRKINIYPKERARARKRYREYGISESDKLWRANNTDKIKETMKRSNIKQNKKLPDCVIVARLKKCGLKPSPETIELKRQQIIMKRTMKEFKKWRKENESMGRNNDGEQQHQQGIDE